MRSTLLLGSSALLAGVSAQLSLPSSILGLSFSAPCQQAITSILTNGSFAQCSHFSDLFPALLSNTSLVPALDTFMSDVCYTAPCTNDTLQTAAMTILSGCAADLAGEGLSNSTVTTAFSIYPLVREILCLKTSDYYTNQSFGGSLGNAPIPISSAYNTTGGIFCVTSLLTQLTAYLGANLTVPYIESLVTGMNTTGLGLIESINSLVLCNECIFAAVDVLESVYPFTGELPALALIDGYLNMTASTNASLNTILNTTCAYKPLVADSNGTLPANISVSIINSTFPFNLTNGTTTFSPSPTMRKRLFGLV